jgi:hypothetical protein
MTNFVTSDDQEGQERVDFRMRRDLKDHKKQLFPTNRRSGMEAAV